MEARTEVKTRPSEGVAAVEVTELLGRQRLRRALAQRDTLEEFLVDPEEVAKQFGVRLTEREVAAVQRAGHFVSEWDRRCGGGRWVETIPTLGEERRRIRRQEAIEDVVDNAVRERVVEEVLEELPEAIRRAADRLGGEAFVRPEREVGEIPAPLRPIRRVIGDISQRITRALEHEMNLLALYGAYLRRSASPAAAAGRDGSLSPTEADPVDLPVVELRRHLIAVMHRAVEEAIERTRSGAPRRLGEPEAPRPAPRRP